MTHFKVAFSLSIKARAGPQPFISENEFYLHVYKISFSNEGMDAKTSFENELFPVICIVSIKPVSESKLDISWTAR